VLQVAFLVEKSMMHVQVKVGCASVESAGDIFEYMIYLDFTVMDIRFKDG
jgi:hypothetical protein